MRNILPVRQPTTSRKASIVCCLLVTGPASWLQYTRHAGVRGTALGSSPTSMLCVGNMSWSNAAGCEWLHAKCLRRVTSRTCSSQEEPAKQQSRKSDSLSAPSVHDTVGWRGHGLGNASPGQAARNSSPIAERQFEAVKRGTAAEGEHRHNKSKEKQTKVTKNA